MSDSVHGKETFVAATSPIRTEHRPRHRACQKMDPNRVVQSRMSIAHRGHLHVTSFINEVSTSLKPCTKIWYLRQEQS